MAESPRLETISLAGTRIACLTRHQVVEFVGTELKAGRGGWVITTNVDHLQRATADARLRGHYDEARLVVADGVPLLWAARLQGTPLPDRVAGSDLVWLLAEHAAHAGGRLYLLGGAPGTAAATASRLRDRWASLDIAGWSSPRISEIPSTEELTELAAALGDTRPSIVYVALGSPKTEHLISALHRQFPSVWWVGVGISFSFIAEQVRRAPTWMQRSGLEWLHRLIQEPRRLARRYLIDDIPFLIRLMLRSWRTRQLESRGPRITAK